MSFYQQKAFQLNEGEREMNNVSLAGNLTRDPELRKTNSGKDIVSFSLAINESKDKTEFVNCIAWEKTAELINQYVKKGDRLSCTGKIQTRKWQDKQGNDRATTEIVVREFDFPPKRQEVQQDYQAPLQDDLEDEIPF